MKEYSDSEIIECLRTRQSYVVRYLSDRYLPMIRLMVFRLGGTLEDAKDIFQDGLIIMLEKIDSDDFVLTCKFKTFLYVVCENLWKSVLDKRQAAAKYFSRKTDDEFDDDFTELQDNRLYESIFYEVFDTLDPACQKILKFYWEELTPDQIASRMGVTNGYVRKKKSEAQSQLVARIKQHPDYLEIMKSDNISK